MNYEEITKKITLIGLTGQSGAGKTTVSDTFKEEGIPVINADFVAREVVKPKSPCLNDVIRAFGNEYLLPNGNLNRKMLANTVFTSKTKLSLLNSIMYPYITREILGIADEYSKGGEKIVIVDAPTLFESGIDKYCKKIISVISDINVRLKRIIKRDNITGRSNGKNKQPVS